MKKLKNITALLLVLSLVLSMPACASAEGTEATPAAIGNSDVEAASYPEIVSISPDASGFTLKWTAYPGAVKYRLFVRGASGWNRVGDTAATTLRHTGLKDQTAYTYTVRALDVQGKYMSSYLVKGWSSTFYAAPELISVAAYGDALKITWKKNPTVNCYRVYRKTGTGWIGLGFSDGDSFLDTDVTSGNTYTYTVRAFADDRRTILSGYQAAGKSATFVPVPQITNIEMRNTGLRITWSKFAGADQYRVFVKASNGWKRIGDTYNSYFDYSSPVIGVASTYTVRAMDDYGRYTSDFSREGMTHTALNTPKMTAVENLVGGQKITWQKVAGAQLYRIYVRSGSTWLKLADTAALSYTAKNLKNNTNYTYTIRCLSADGRSFMSGFHPQGMMTRYYDAPKITAVENVRSGAHLTWNKITGAAKYRVFTKAASGWKKLDDVTDTEYTHTAAVQGTTYTYTVRALDSSGRYISSFYSLGFSNHYQTAPLISNVIPAADGAIVAWSEFGGATRYRIFRRYLDSSGWSRIADVDGLSYTDTGAEKGVPCQYTLRCLDEAGNLTSDYYDNKLYYVDGVLAEGEINVKGYLVTFSKGKVTKGYVTAQDVIRIAQGEVGYQAKNYRRCKYNTWYYGAEVSGDEYHWCVVFLEWVFDQAGARDLLYENTAGAEFFGLGFYKRGRLLKSGFKVGDLLLLHWKDGRSDYVPGFPLLNHCGIIIAVNDDGSYTTIEGNTGDNPNGEVVIKRRYPDLISAACRPAYGFTIPAD